MEKEFRFVVEEEPNRVFYAVDEGNGSVRVNWDRSDGKPGVTYSKEAAKGHIQQGYWILL